ncbi:MAG: sigma-70 family RNA polymerase sigma factor [Acidobacteriota bacterium]
MDDESQLIRRVIARQPEAEEEFLRRYSGLVLGLARGRFGLSEEAAEEVLQSTLEKLWSKDFRALRAWRGQGRFTSYLTVIVTHQLLRRRAAQGRQREQGVDPADLVRLADVGPGTGGERPSDAALIARERRRHVDAEWQQLSPRDRLLLALRFGDDRSPKEIARVTGQASGTVRKAIHDAIRRLRRRLASRQPELFDPSETEVARPVLAPQGRRS